MKLPCGVDLVVFLNRFEILYDFVVGDIDH